MRTRAILCFYLACGAIEAQNNLTSTGDSTLL